MEEAPLAEYLLLADPIGCGCCIFRVDYQTACGHPWPQLVQILCSSAADC